MKTKKLIFQLIKSQSNAWTIHLQNVIIGKMEEAYEENFRSRLEV